LATVAGMRRNRQYDPRFQTGLTTGPDPAKFKPMLITIMARSKLRVFAIGTCLFSFLLCSCTTQNPAPASLPVETSFNESVVGDSLFATLVLETGEKLLFSVDTGNPLTILDKSEEGKLGKRLGTVKFNFAFRHRENAGIYKSPKLFLGSAQLLTGPRILTADLRQEFGTNKVAGILGMDCLRHYCLQLDFGDQKLRFLNPDDLNTDNLGRAFPLVINRYSIGNVKEGSVVFVNASFSEEGNVNFWLDTGLYGDGDILLESKRFRRALRELKPDETNDLSLKNASMARFPMLKFGGETYTNTILGNFPDGLWSFQGWIGLRFLARHLVTLNFPKRTMYLKQESIGPVRQTN
jgi:hypothetical protein